MGGRNLWLALAGLWVLAAFVLAAVLISPDAATSRIAIDQPPVGDDAAMSASPHEADHELAPTEAPHDSEPAVTAPDVVAISPAQTDEETDEETDAELREESDDETEGATEPTAQPERRVGARPDVVIGSDDDKPRDFGNVRVVRGGSLTMPSGEVRVGGNFDNQGTVHASESTVVFDGDDQTLDGKVAAKRVVLSGGTKRLRGEFASLATGTSKPGEAGLHVEAGTTLIIEKGGKWTIPNRFGFRIDGNLVIDGGEFHCSFSHGDGDEGEESWGKGSTLTIHSGKFVGNGDANFDGATITIHGGALEINDDIWGTGDALTIHGGLMRNTIHGGMFRMTGTVTVRDGQLRVYQNAHRSLRIAEGASVYCTGGEVSINGKAATHNDGGILLGASVTLPNLVINANTKIHRSTPETAYLSVAGDMHITKGNRFEARGYQVIASFNQTPETGEFIP